MRILLLAGIGIMVYLKFDSVVASRSFQNIRHPGLWWAGFSAKEPSATERMQSSPLRWNADSSLAEAECAAGSFDSCFAAWKGMDQEALGTLRATLQKVRIQWNAGAIGSFRARFLRTHANADLLHPNGSALALSRLELRLGREDLILNREIGKAGAFCAADKCLDASHPRPPFAHFHNPSPGDAGYAGQSGEPQAEFIATENAAAQPVLPGKIMAIPADLAKDWLEIYHGENIFSFYRGFTRLRPGLRTGSLLDARDTLGFVEPPGQGTVSDAGPTGRKGLQVRIEKNGLPMDPLAWLGIASVADGINVADAGAIPPGGAEHAR